MQTFVYRHDDAERQDFVNGHYELGEPMRTVVDGHDVLYSLGSALLDNSCCGSFGCAYALVIGETIKQARSPDSPDLAQPFLVRQIDADEPLAERIRVALLEREAINVVNFYVPPQPVGGAGE